MSHSPERVRPAPIEGIQSYWTTVRGLSVNAKLFLLTTAFRGMVIASLQTVVNLYLNSLGYDARFIGVITAVNSLAVLVVSLPFGYLADRFGQQRLLLIGGIAYPLSLLGIAVVHSTAAIVLFNFLFGAFAAAYWVAGIPLLFASTSERDRVHAFSINSFLLWGLGPVGALASGQAVEIAARVLAVSPSSSGALRVGMVFMVFLAAAGTIPYLFLHPTPPVRREAEPPPPMGSLAGLFGKLLVPDLVLSFGLGAVLTFSQLYFLKRFGLDPGPIGAVVAVGGATAGVGTLLTPALARRWGNLRTAVRFQWAVVPLIATVALAPQLLLAVPAYWLLVMLRGMSDPVYTAFVQERVPGPYRARVTSFYNVTYSIGYSLGPAASGALQKAGGFTPAFLLGAIAYGVGATMLYLFFRSSDGPEAAQVPVTDESVGA